MWFSVLAAQASYNQSFASAENLGNKNCTEATAVDNNICGRVISWINGNPVVQNSIAVSQMMIDKYYFA